MAASLTREARSGQALGWIRRLAGCVDLTPVSRRRLGSIVGNGLAGFCVSFRSRRRILALRASLQCSRTEQTHELARAREIAICSSQRLRDGHNGLFAEGRRACLGATVDQ
jgi:hypothetical protein